MLKEKMRSQKGFTLIELVVVLAITAVLMAVGIPMMSGYMVSSEMMDLNQTAKTFFLSAQDYLTQAAAGGRLDEINAASHPVPLGSVIPAPSEEEMTDNAGNIRCLVLSRIGADDAELQRMLDLYVGDRAMLDGSVLVEYNSKTGVVRSVFFSRRAETLGYDGAVTDPNNVIDRQEAALIEKRQGYYGVVYTGKLGAAAPLGNPNVTLVNSDRLTAEWTDVTPSGGMDFLTYTLTIYSEDWQREYLRVEGIPNSVAADSPLARTKAGSETTPIPALSTFWGGSRLSESDAKRQQHSVSVERSETGNKIIFILDDIHQSIYDKYPSIPLGNIQATVEVNLDWIQVAPGQTQKSENSFFADQVLEQVGGQMKYGVKFARHLNNVRHAPPESGFNQTEDINWAVPEDVKDANLLKVPFETVYFRYRDFSGGEPTGAEKIEVGGYQGSYGGNNKTISNLTVSGVNSATQPAGYDTTENIGWFAKLKGAKISGVKLKDIVVNVAAGDKPVSIVGTFAGSAEDATLTNCRVESSADGKSVVASNGIKTAEQEPANAGGLIGYAKNTKLTNVYSTALVSSGTLETVDGDTVKVQNGRDNVGGIVGLMEGGSLENAESQMNVFGGNNVGGIVGRNKGGQLEILKNNNGKYTVGSDNVGGIVGFNESGSVTGAECINSMLGLEDATFGDEAELKSVFTELKASTANFETNLLVFKKNMKGVLGKENVGGVIGKNGEDATLENFKTQQKVKGGLNAGGIVGFNVGGIKWNSTNNKSDGLVICAGQYAGGILGANTNESIELTGLSNGSHIVAKQYAGGIIGTNGLRDVVGSTGATIKTCINEGVVFAYDSYAGGIAGCNTGTIEECKSIAGNADKLDELLQVSEIPYGNYVGGITGYNNGNIIKCDNSNLVKGKNYVGGITGHNDTSGNIFNCKTLGGRVIASENFAGGFIGLNTSDQLTESASGEGEDDDDKNELGKAMGDLVNQASLVQGRLFVGGIIGCNKFTQGNLVIQATNGTDKAADKQPQIIGDGFVGGIIGYNCIALDEADLPKLGEEFTASSGAAAVSAKTTLLRSDNYGTVTAARYAGGIIGLNHPDSKLTVDNCSNKGAISYQKPSQGAGTVTSNFYYIAGITGRNTSSGHIIGCKNEGKVTNQSKYTGGLVEVNEGLIEDCVNTGEITSDRSYVGGIAGFNRTLSEVENGTNKKATIRNCMNNDGLIKGVNFIGGITGENRAVLEGCTFQGKDTGYNNQTFNVAGTGYCVGGITGYNQTDGVMIGCSTSGGSVKGTNFVGGLAGYSTSTVGINGVKAADGTVKEVVNGSRVMGQYFVGGIVGYHTGSSISYCSNGATGRVIGTGAPSNGNITITIDDNKEQTFSLTDMGVGGIVGTNDQGKTLTNCTNKGVVAGAGNQTGGITGLNKGQINSCTNSGTVKGSSNASELGAADKLKTISCNRDNVGGIVGRNAATGTITGVTAQTTEGSSNLIAGNRNIGGIVGLNQGTLTNPVSQDVRNTVEGMGYVGGLVGKWDSGATITIADKKVAATVVGNAAGRAQTTGTPALPASIGGVYGYIDAAADPAPGKDVDALALDGYVFEGVVTYANSVEYQYVGGIIGLNPKNRTLKNCVNKGSVSANTQQDITSGVGGITGYNQGIVTSCALDATGKVSGTNNVGGIIGHNSADGTMGLCANGSEVGGVVAGGTVNGSGNRTGGFIGYDRTKAGLKRSITADANDALVNYASVEGYNKVGGIVGESNGSIANCTNRGTVVRKGTSGGGIVGTAAFASGLASVTIDQCYNEGTVTSSNKVSLNNYYLGGIVGSAQTKPGAGASDTTTYLTISNCENRGTINTVEQYAGDIGGIVGELQRLAEVKNSSNTSTGTVSFSVNEGRGVGGIAGFVNGGTVTNCTNAGAVSFLQKKEDINPLSGGIKMGGIAGRAINGVLSGCENKGTLATESGYAQINIGGIVGFTTKQGVRGTVITDCTNSAPINLKECSNVGGIGGSLSGTQISGCENAASLTAKSQVGGIVGTLYRSAFGKDEANTIAGSTNTGVITSSSDSNGGILGNITAWEATVAITNCENKADVVLTGNGEGIGGIVGRINFSLQTPNTITSCSNSGEVYSENGVTAKGIGGILGLTSLPVRIDSCSNIGAIGKSGSAGAVTNIGGVVGSLDNVNSIVTDCTNSAPVSSRGDNVGGIVGRNVAQVRACANLSSGIVSGNARVGGIAGESIGNSAIIYTNITLLPDVGGGAPLPSEVKTYNEAAVTGVSQVGGIVGSNMGGGIVSTYNAGAVDGRNAVGGLIGTASFSGKAIGSIANSYNLGKVTGTTHLGGVIGERNPAYDSKNGHNIKYAFYLGEIQDSSLTRSVGNEPDETVDINDEPGGLLINRRLSDSAFTDNSIGVPNYHDIADVIAKVKALIKVTNYHLEQPRNVGTVSDKGYEYTTSWDVVQGMVSGYRVYLRPKAVTEKDLEDPHELDILLGEVSAADQEGRLKNQLTFNIQDIYNANADAKGFTQEHIDSFEKLIGKKYDIVVETLGMQQGGGASLNSWNRISELDRKFLPVLPTPGTPVPVIYEVQPGKKYKITIPHEAYTVNKIDKATYPNLGEDTIYNSPYSIGLNTFWAENVTIKPGETILTGIVNLTTPYTFTLDHSAEKSTETKRTIRMQARSTDIKDVYAHSEIAEIEYKVQIRLEPPTGLRTSFVGTDKEAAYELKWNGVDNNEGYRVRISYVDKDGNPQVTTVDVPKNTLLYKWTVPEGGVGSRDASFTVTTLGENETKPEADATYLTSVPSASKEIRLPIQLQKPTVMGDQDSNEDTRFTLKWTTADNIVDVKNFVLTAARYPIGGDPALEEKYAFTTGGGSSETIATSVTTRDITFKEEDFGYIYIFRMSAGGINGTSMTSDLGSFMFTLYPRRSTPSAVAVEKDVNDKLTFKFTWDKNTSTAAPYPAGELSGNFVLVFTHESDPSFVPVRVPYNLAAGSVSYQFKAENKFVPGQKYDARLMALAEAGKYSKSKQSEPRSFQLPAPLPTPAGVKVVAGSATPAPAADYDKTQHTISWNAYSPEIQALMASTNSYQIKAFVTIGGVETEITSELKFDNGRPADQPNPQDKLIPRDTGIKFSAPAKYAGKEVTVQVIAKGGNEACDSALASAKATLPKAQLSAPIVSSAEKVDKVLPDVGYDVKVMLKDDDDASKALLDALAAHKDVVAQFFVQVDIKHEVIVDTVLTEETLTIELPVENFVTADAPPVAIKEFSLLQADLLNKYNEGKDPADQLTELPADLISISAQVRVNVYKTTETGFVNSDGTDSTLEPGTITIMPPGILGTPPKRNESSSSSSNSSSSSSSSSESSSGDGSSSGGESSSGDGSSSGGESSSGDGSSSGGESSSSDGSSSGGESSSSDSSSSSSESSSSGGSSSSSSESSSSDSSSSVGGNSSSGGESSTVKGST